MPLDIDGYAVLGAIARKPDAFPAIKNDVSKISRTLVVKQLKEKSLSLDMARDVVAAIGDDAFDMILEPMTDAEIKALLSKIDKFDVDTRKESAQIQRKHISQLVKGEKAPAIKQTQAKAPKVKAPPKEKAPLKAKVERAANSRAMKAKKLV